MGMEDSWLGPPVGTGAAFRIRWVYVLPDTPHGAAEVLSLTQCAFTPSPTQWLTSQVQDGLAVAWSLSSAGAEVLWGLLQSCLGCPLCPRLH